MPGSRNPRQDFAARLDALYATFDHPDAATDPVQIVRRYRSSEDREVVGFCAAALAFGRVASVLQSIEALLEVMGPHPAAFLREFKPVRHSRRIEPLVHRWIRGRDLVALLLILQRMLRQSGSIEAFFAEGDDPSAPDIGPALDSFAKRALATDLREAYGKPTAKRPGVCYFFPRPSAGSACKRLNLFLRWMVRKDAIDMGVWTSVSPSRLVVPLDTHVIRLGHCLRLQAGSCARPNNANPALRSTLRRVRFPIGRRPPNNVTGTVAYGSFWQRGSDELFQVGVILVRRWPVDVDHVARLVVPQGNVALLDFL